MNFDACTLQGLTEETAEKICQWEYEEPYSDYNFKGHPNGYLLNKSTWGNEQFCLICGEEVIGQVACQLTNDDLWVGWSLNPSLCGKGDGYNFVTKCVDEIRHIKKYDGKIFLRVALRNQRAIRAYQKAGFVYNATIQDEIPSTNITEDFWIMNK